MSEVERARVVASLPTEMPLDRSPESTDRKAQEPVKAGIEGRARDCRAGRAKSC